MAKQNITDRVKTYADACAVLGIKETLPDVGGLRPKDRPSVTAYYKLIVIAQALNEGWEPDWTNKDQPKWFPWFYFDREKNKTAGFALAFACLAPTSAYAASAPGFASKRKRYANTPPANSSRFTKRGSFTRTT